MPLADSGSGGGSDGGSDGGGYAGGGGSGGGGVTVAPTITAGGGKLACSWGTSFTSNSWCTLQKCC